MYNIDLIVHNYANYAKYTLTDRFLNELYKAIILAIQLYSIQLNYSVIHCIIML